MTSSANPPPAGRVVLGDEAAMARWCEWLGCTQQQLEEAVLAVGSDATKVHEHLLHQGSSSGAG